MYIGDFNAPGVGLHSATWPEQTGVCCVWLPRFPLRVEVLRHPAWDGHPLVLGSGPGERKVVQLCSPEAERAGIRPGLPLREVLALCREAIVLQPDPVRMAAVRGEIVQSLQRVSPVVERGEEYIFLGLHGLRASYRGDLRFLESAIRAAVSPLLQPRAGLANGKFTASLAARLALPSGIRVVPAPETVAFLAPLPVQYLPLPQDELRRLDLLGLRTIGALAALPFSAVQAEFGPTGARAWRLARGQDGESLVPQRIEPVIHAALALDTPLASTEAIIAVLKHLIARSFGDPTLSGRMARQVRLRALLADGTSWARLFTFKEPLSNQDVVCFALKSKLELPNALPAAPMEELALELMGLGGEAAKQPSLISTRSRQLEPLVEAARHLRARYGHVPLYHVVEMEPWSRIPERRWALVPYVP